VHNPNGTAPVNAFNAVYLDMRNPRQAVAEEFVKDIAIKYSTDKFHGIPSQSFGAYWIGQLDFPKAEMRVINVSQGWSRARITIDGHEIYEGGNAARQEFLFSKGPHLIEVEYVNHWHTTEFRVSFDKQLQSFDRAQIRKALARRGIVNPKVHYVGLYESESNDLSVRLQPTRMVRNAVLVLSSNSPVNWVIDQPAASGVRAIIYHSSSPASTVSGSKAGDTLLLPSKEQLGGYKFESRCSVLAMKAPIEKLTGGRLASVTGMYRAWELILPGDPVPEEVTRGSKALLEAEARRREQCAAVANTDSR
jgi:hypothetical protein